MSDITIYHNGECSKCRGALEILQERNIPHIVRWYLADPLSKEELSSLLEKLSMRPSEIIRRNEPVYKDQFEGKDFSEDVWLDLLVSHPILIERPVIEKGPKAILGRPPKRVFEMI